MRAPWPITRKPSSGEQNWRRPTAPPSLPTASETSSKRPGAYPGGWGRHRGCPPGFDPGHPKGIPPSPGSPGEDLMRRPCTRCGTPFESEPTGGRPRTRCDSCRSSHARIDGTKWRALRRRVLAEEPTCAVDGCLMPSSQVDHVVPLARGGPELDRANLQGLCLHHNASKGARIDFTARQMCACGDPSCPGRWHL
jgi:5-methylcytosine-specific restriction endonuclease McrA